MRQAQVQVCVRFATILVATLLLSGWANAAVMEFQGHWAGALQAGPRTLPLTLRVSADGKAVLDSPSQNVAGLQGTAVQTGSTVRVSFEAIGAAYEGDLSVDRASVTGAWRQSGQAFPLRLQRQIHEPAGSGAPSPYRTEEVVFASREVDWRFRGTLTLPHGAGPFAVVLLITGSGMQDRDETVLGQKPFLRLADALTRAGVAVLRVDDRGFPTAPQLFSEATTADFVTDASDAVSFLRSRPDIQTKRIGLLGHSEGASVAVALAARDPDISFLVLLAAPALPGRELILLQNRDVARAQGRSAAEIVSELAGKAKLFDAAREAPSLAMARKQIDAELARQGIGPESPAHQAWEALATNWWRYSLNYDPAPDLRKVRGPVLALYGGKDVQVPAPENAAAMRAHLAAHRDATVVTLPRLNHLFQEAETGLPREFATAGPPVAEPALSKIVAWITKICGPEGERGSPPAQARQDSSLRQPGD